MGRFYLDFKSIEATFKSFLLNNPRSLRRWLEDHGFSAVCVSCWMEPDNEGCNHLWPCGKCRKNNRECRYVFCSTGIDNTDCRYGHICKYLHKESLRFFAWVGENCSWAIDEKFIDQFVSLTDILYLAPTNTMVHSPSLEDCMLLPDAFLVTGIKSIFNYGRNGEVSLRYKRLADVPEGVIYGTLTMYSRWCSEDEVSALRCGNSTFYADLFDYELHSYKQGRLAPDNSPGSEQAVAFAEACTNILARIANSEWPHIPQYVESGYVEEEEEDADGDQGNQVHDNDEGGVLVGEGGEVGDINNNVGAGAETNVLGEDTIDGESENNTGGDEDGADIVAALEDNFDAFKANIIAEAVAAAAGA